jgi:hypothetical protein
MPNIVVSTTELEKLNALRKMAKAFPEEADRFKARKQQWWAEVRATHKIPKGVKLTVGTETGTLMDKATGLPYEPPPVPMFYRLPLNHKRVHEALLKAAHDMDGMVPAATTDGSDGGLYFLAHDDINYGETTLFVRAPDAPAAEPALVEDLSDGGLD